MRQAYVKKKHILRNETDFFSSVYSICCTYGTWHLNNLMFVIFSCCVCLHVHVQGGAMGRYVQRKLSGLKIFEEPFVSVRENLRTGVAICEQWVVACEHLTGQVCMN